MRRAEGPSASPCVNVEDIVVPRRRAPADSPVLAPRAISIDAPCVDDPLVMSISTADENASVWSAVGTSPPSTPPQDPFPAARRSYYRRGDMRPRHMRVVFVILVVVLLVATYPTDRAQELKDIREQYGAPLTTKASATAL